MLWSLPLTASAEGGAPDLRPEAAAEGALGGVAVPQRGQSGGGPLPLAVQGEPGPQRVPGVPHHGGGGGAPRQPRVRPLVGRGERGGGLPGERGGPLQGAAAAPPAQGGAEPGELQGEVFGGEARTEDCCLATTLTFHSGKTPGWRSSRLFSIFFLGRIAIQHEQTVHRMSVYPFPPPTQAHAYMHAYLHT